jgi:hypothetical protein
MLVGAVEDDRMLRQFLDRVENRISRRPMLSSMPAVPQTFIRIYMNNKSSRRASLKAHIRIVSELST